jgi:flagellar biogenesis protein FliO
VESHLLTALGWLQLTASAGDQINSAHSPIVQYFEVLLALGGILVIAYVSLRFGLPRLFGMQTSSRGPIQVLSRYALEPKSTLYLVKTGSQVFLIGTSDRQIQYLTAIEPENATEMLELAQRAERSPRSIRQIFRLERSRQA